MELLMAVNKELLAYYEALGNQFAPLTLTSSPNDRRERYLDITQGLAPANVHGLSVQDLEIALSGRTLQARSFSPQAHKAHKLMVFFHGGGWVIGDLDSHHALCADLSRALNAVVVSVDYRMAPEHIFPAAHDDAIDSLIWCAEQLLSFGCSELSVGGDSAGAHLAAQAAFEAQEFRGVTVSSQYLIYPVVKPDFASNSYVVNEMGPGLTSADMQWYWRTYCPSDEILQQWTNARISLLAQDWKNPPPATVIVTAGHDPLRDEGLAYAEFLAHQGARLRLVHAPDMTHGFIRLGSVNVAARHWFDQMVLPIS
jgi:acetyl esterase